MVFHIDRITVHNPDSIHGGIDGFTYIQIVDYGNLQYYAAYKKIERSKMLSQQQKRQFETFINHVNQDVNKFRPPKYG